MKITSEADGAILHIQFSHIYKVADAGTCPHCQQPDTLAVIEERITYVVASESYCNPLWWAEEAVKERLRKNPDEYVRCYKCDCEYCNAGGPWERSMEEAIIAFVGRQAEPAEIKLIFPDMRKEDPARPFDNFQLPGAVFLGPRPQAGTTGEKPDDNMTLQSKIDLHAGIFIQPDGSVITKRKQKGKGRKPKQGETWQIEEGNRG